MHALGSRETFQDIWWSLVSSSSAQQRSPRFVQRQRLPLSCWAAPAGAAALDELASRDDEAASIEAAGPSATEIGGGCVALSPISAERSKALIKIPFMFYLVPLLFVCFYVLVFVFCYFCLSWNDVAGLER